jgi:hypothetical protein
MLETLLTAAFLAYCGRQLYRMGYDRAEALYMDILMQVQYPPGCSCIRNALLPSAGCKHHGHLA